MAIPLSEGTLKQMIRLYLKLSVFNQLSEYDIYKMIGTKLNLHFMTISDHISKLSRFKANEIDSDFALKNNLISDATLKKII